KAAARPRTGRVVLSIVFNGETPRSSIGFRPPAPTGGATAADRTISTHRLGMPDGRDVHRAGRLSFLPQALAASIFKTSFRPCARLSFLKRAMDRIRKVDASTRL